MAGLDETSNLPEFLTIEEAARLLRIGRNPAYEQANLFLETGGREGLPVVVFGRTRRVPRRMLEELAGGAFSPGSIAPKPRVPELRVVETEPMTDRPQAVVPKRQRKPTKPSEPRLFG